MPALDWRERRRRSTLILALALALAAGAVTVASDRCEAARRTAPPERVLYLPRDRGFQVMCLGYDGVAADLVWIRGVLYAGKHLRDRETKYEWLGKLFRVASDLDPHWEAPYVTGAILLSALPQDDEAALDLLRRGMSRNPESLYIPWRAAEILLLRGRDREALRYLNLINRCMPNRPPSVPVLIAAVRREGNDYRGALRTAAEALAGSRASLLREAAGRQYREALARLTEQELTGAWAVWQARSARPPRSLAELVARADFQENMRERLKPLAGQSPAESFVRALPRDPYGMEFVLRADGAVKSRGLERLELFRLTQSLNRYLERFEQERGRSAQSLDELKLWLGALDRAGELPAGARERYGGGRFPAHPEGLNWKDAPLSNGRLLPPEKPGESELLSAPLEMPAPEG